MKNKLMLLALLLVSFAAAPAFAQAVVQAEQGTVVSVAYATPTPSQAPQPAYGYYGGNSGGIAGGAIGGLVGLLAGHHSRYGYAVGAAGAAIGYAVGHARDRAAYAERVNAPQQRVGLQVVVEITSGYGHRLVSVFVPQTGVTFAPGQRVYVVGNDELIPAN